MAARGSGGHYSYTKQPALMHPSSDITGIRHNWIWGRKYNGVRGYWDGSRFCSRSGVVITPSREIVQMMPRGFKIDGEFYSKIDDVPLHTIADNVFAESTSPVWKNIQFIAFDLHGPLPFRTRYEKLKKLMHGKAVVRFDRLPVGHLTLDNLMDIALTHNWEGVIVRDPGAPYTPGRHKTMVKIKPQREITAVATSRPGVFKNNNDPNMAPFFTFKNHDRIKPPIREGDEILFVYTGVSAHKKPMFPRFVRFV